MAALTARLRVSNAVQTLLCGSPVFPQGIKFLSLPIILRKTKDSIQKSSVRKDSMCAFLGPSIIASDVRAKASFHFSGI